MEELSVAVGGYVLNFGGRASCASLKNFQLVCADGKAYFNPHRRSSGVATRKGWERFIQHGCSPSSIIISGICYLPECFFLRITLA